VLQCVGLERAFELDSIRCGNRVSFEPLPRVPEKARAQLIADLDNNDFKTREKAARELDKLGEAALGAIHTTLAGNPSVEAQQRLASLRDKHRPWGVPSPERLRLMRALEVLELCGPDSHDLLSTLAESAPGALVTEQAKGALKRLSR
jgi:hypothetical protein